MINELSEISLAVKAGVDERDQLLLKNTREITLAAKSVQKIGQALEQIGKNWRSNFFSVNCIMLSEECLFIL